MIKRPAFILALTVVGRAAMGQAADSVKDVQATLVLTGVPEYELGTSGSYPWYLVKRREVKPLPKIKIVVVPSQQTVSLRLWLVSDNDDTLELGKGSGKGRPRKQPWVFRVSIKSEYTTHDIEWWVLRPKLCGPNPKVVRLRVSVESSSASLESDTEDFVLDGNTDLCAPSMSDSAGSANER